MKNQVHQATMYYILLFCVVVSIQETVKVSVFYESLCPDSVRFINNQFVPAWSKLSKGIELDLVPYGFANQSQHKGHWKFTCQHGPAECQGNRLHACLINSLSPKRNNKLVKIIGCLMGNNDHIKALPACTKKLGLNPQKFIKCAKGDKSGKLLADYGNRTKNVTPKITWIPSISFNDVLNKNESSAAEQDFENVVCKYIPDMCSSTLHQRNIIEKY